MRVELTMQKYRNVLMVNYNRHKPGELHGQRTLEYHDIIYIRKGGWSIGVEGDEYILKTGDILFLPAGYRHYGTEKYLPGVETIYAHISAEPDDRLISTDCGSALSGHKSDCTLTLPVYVSGGDIIIKMLFEDLIAAFWGNLPQKNIKCSIIADMLIYEIMLAGDKEITETDIIANRILQIIRTSPHSFISLDELSDSLHFSSRALTKKFKKATGQSIHQYQMHLKLSMARELILDNPERSLRDIARNFGFYDEFHFSRMFKMKYGYPPGSFKNFP